MPTREQASRWGKLHIDSKAAEQDARKVEHQIIKEFTECVVVDGTGPSIDLIARAKQMRIRADEFKNMENQFLKGLFN